jgi:hypothetical protein
MKFFSNHPPTHLTQPHHRHRHARQQLLGFVLIASEDFFVLVFGPDGLGVESRGWA